MRLFRKLTTITSRSAVEFRSDEAHDRLALATRDEGTRAHIADLQIMAAVSAGYVARMGSSDPVVRAAAHAEWNAENAHEIAAARQWRATAVAAAAARSRR
jgi:hypothetical protein